MVKSLVWTPEEAKYLKAVLRWQASAASDDERGHRPGTDAEEGAARRRRQEQQGQETPAGEFRVLVMGGRRTGKTAILTRFAQGTFRGEGEPADPSYGRGCRHPITLDSSGLITPLPSPTNPDKDARPQPQTYMVDALEMPSRHLLSNPMLEQALAMTDAAVLVYDVRDEASFRLARGLADFVREYFSSSPFATPNMNNNNDAPRHPRPYALVLVGNKADSDSEDSEDADPLSHSLSSSSSSSSQPAGDDEPRPEPERQTQRQRPKRQVTWAEGSRAAARMGIRMPLPAGRGPGGGAAFLEVSARTGENVDQIFQAAGREVLRLRRLAALQRREQLERAEGMMVQETTGTGTGTGRGVAAGKSAEEEAARGRKTGARFGLWRSLFVGRRQAAAAGY